VENEESIHDRNQRVANFIHTPTGDANNDGQVGLDDFLILSTNFGQQNASWIDGDFDGDAHVAFYDFLGMSENFGGVVAAVPEPSATCWRWLGCWESGGLARDEPVEP